MLKFGKGLLPEPQRRPPPPPTLGQVPVRALEAPAAPRRSRYKA
jgi:hypothetical protein